jgi:hypothetical protein
MEKNCGWLSQKPLQSTLRLKFRPRLPPSIRRPSLAKDGSRIAISINVQVAWHSD